MYNSGLFNPYMYQPYAQGMASSMIGNTTKRGILGGLFSKFSWNGFLTGAGKTLNVVNQAIPIFYQVKPMFNNAKTMFRIMGAVKDDKPKTISSNIQTQTVTNSTNTNIPTIQNTTYSQEGYNEGNPAFFI